MDKEMAMVFRWDDASIEREALTIPEELREDYRYLKSFVRDDCNKDMDLFLQKALELGIETDKTTWGKVLRGRLVIDRHGRAQEYPVISFTKFSEMVKSLRDNMRIEALRGRIGFIETDTTRQIFTYIQNKWQSDTVNKFGLIVGATGSGKSATVGEYRRRNNHGACVHIEAPEAGGAGEFIQGLCRCYGISTRTNSTRMRNQLWSAVGARNCIIVDNAQELWNRKGGPDQPRFSFLRRLQDERKCTVILIVTPLFERTLQDNLMLGYFEQFIGRTGGVRSWLRLPEYPPMEDCVAIAKSMGLVDAQKHAKKLAEIARESGRIRRLFEDLQSGKRLAQGERSPFTFDYVLDVRGEA